jgi:uncharacterized membrane protein
LTRIATASARLVAIDALRGLAIVAMALDHAAAAARVSLQAESYGGQMAALGSLPSWVLGLVTNIAAPTFWLLAGVSVWLYSSARLKRGATNGEITRFFLIRAGVLAVLDLTIAWLAWTGSTPYTHVLLSLAISLALLSLARLLPFKAFAVIAVAWFIGYQLALPSLATQFTDGAGVAYWQALSFYFSYHTFPASEFSILGWGSLMFLGYVLGRYVQSPHLRRWQTWALIGLGMFGLWLALRLLGGFGDLAAYTRDLPIYYFVIMNKTPPSLTFLLFNLGIAALLYALLQMNESWLQGRPGVWLVWMGQVSLFAFVVHLVIYGLLGRIAVALPLPLPGVVKALTIWLIGLCILIPLVKLYRQARKQRPDSLLRYL